MRLKAAQVDAPRQRYLPSMPFGLAKKEGAIIDQHLKPNTFSAFVDKGKVGLIVLEQVRINGCRCVNRCGKSGTTDKLLHNIAVGHIYKRLCFPSTRQTMAAVIGANRKGSGKTFGEIEVKRGDFASEHTGKAVCRKIRELDFKRFP